MNLILVAIAILVALLLAGSWLRRGDSGIRQWMLDIPGLDGLCQDYLDLIEAMDSPGHDMDALRYLDGQRQVTHTQILDELGLDRYTTLDMPEFARRYLGRK